MYPKSPDRRVLHAIALEAMQQHTLALALEFLEHGRQTKTPNIEPDDVEMISLVDLITLHFQKLDQLTQFDYLTELRNRRYFEAQLKQTIFLSQRHKFPFSVALFDIDDFKSLNDQQGHSAGDQALKVVGQLLSQELRESDLVARYGGDEFAVIAPYSDKEDLSIVAQRIQEAFTTANRNTKSPLLSAGWVHVAPESINNDALKIIELADRALYEAKSQGGGIFCISP